MNQRIKELAEQATTTQGPTRYNPLTHQVFDREKFAQLIVQECTSLITKNAPRVTCKENFHLGYVQDGYMYAAELIEQHFGVTL